MRYIESGRSKMSIKESVAKNQGTINSGKDAVEGVKKYRIDKDDRDNSNRNGIGNKNKLGEDAVDALRIDITAVRES